MIRFHSALADLMAPITTLTPHPENANSGDVDELIASVLRNGCYRPIIAAQPSTHILAGHTLYHALGELGAQMVPVLWVQATPADERRILLADNAIAALARLDSTLLLDLLRLVSEDEHGLSGTGYADRDLERLAEQAVRDAETDLRIDLRGSESLVHEITCPNCGYSWVRGQHE